MWLFTPEYGMLVIWTNASTIYQWTMVPLLGFGLIYYRTVSKRGNQNSETDSEEGMCSNLKKLLASVGTLLLGLLAGNSFEPAAATMLLAGFLWLCWCIKKKRKVVVWEITGIIGFFVGFGTMIFSPGNAARSEMIRNHVLGEQNPLWEIVFRIARETYYTARFMAFPIGIAVGLWILASCLEEVPLYRRWREPLLVFLSIVSIYLMTFSIAYANRIMITPTVLLITSIGISVTDIISVLSRGDNLYVRRAIRSVSAVLMVTLTILVLTEYTTAMIEMKQTGKPFIKTIMYTEYNNNLLR